MHIILGATGHVGSAVAHALLDRGEPVTAVTRDGRKAEALARRGAEVAVVDVRDVGALREVFRRGTRAFLLNPPADPSTDTVTEERRTVAAIAQAVAGSGLRKVVVQSTYGAQPGDGLGDLGVLYELEQALAAQPVAVSVIRAAYYMSNWDMSLESARSEGKLHTFYPPQFKLPMVAPSDLGAAAARLLTEEVGHTGIRYVEGPARYSAADVASEFAAALGRTVEAVEIPRTQWEETMRSIGFSPGAAASYARMTAVTIDEAEKLPQAPERCPTTLGDYVRALIAGR
ncbi:NmrA family NAD(P)-binding protein [Hyalangium rubrum]|uniref:NmrA family NAD(P)-binding protein n=1 Tax=Hyalangium rubrum TaxID=3103134 RepID=A0ABU5H0N9_9BACT|nr:NmrA family NAD(P)-binding protein [Hyalangium sp. s54d21]MDY7226672.1 NmrA family NAD(P)-binding protein [Hyalangium sp. s54d21]